MLARAPGELEATAERWAGALNARGAAASVQASRSAVGGGSLPEETLPTFAVALDYPHPDDLMARLRRGWPPVVARIEDGRVVLDPRTVLAEQEDALLDAVAAALHTPK
jgi:L-seryl-tRNA(Ser) seleniumtransferase